MLGPHLFNQCCCWPGISWCRPKAVAGWVAAGLGWPGVGGVGYQLAPCSCLRAQISGLLGVGVGGGVRVVGPGSLVLFKRCVLAGLHQPNQQHDDRLEKDSGVA